MSKVKPHSTCAILLGWSIILIFPVLQNKLDGQDWHGFCVDSLQGLAESRKLFRNYYYSIFVVLWDWPVMVSLKFISLRIGKAEWVVCGEGGGGGGVQGKTTGGR